ncbi:hypothetical protein WN943_006382 [Citrus x changshan-huyou]
MNHKNSKNRGKHKRVWGSKQEQRQTETGLGKQGLEGGSGLTRYLTGPSTEPMRVDHVEGLQEGSLMHTGKVGNNKQERRENRMENETGKVGLVGREEVENDMGQITKNKGMEVSVGGKVRKIKKWKSQAREV